jgi:hypothetical protein
MTYRVGLLVLLMAGCAEVKGSGVRIEQTREIPVFTKVLNSTAVNVRINPVDGKPNTLTCDDNVVDLIETEVKRDELQVTTKGPGYVVSVACVLDVQATVLESVVSSGSGTVEGTGPFQEVASVNSSGSGGVSLDGVFGAGLSAVNSGSGALTLLDVTASTVTVSSSGAGASTLEGNATSGTFTLSGSGAVDASALSLATATVASTGSGDLTLNVSDTVSGSLSGSGDVIVSGGAEVNVSTAGSGGVIEQ